MDFWITLDMADTLQAVEPVFIKDRDIVGGPLTGIEMCHAIIQTVRASKLEGVQKMNNIWRIYLKDRATRLEFCVKERIIINGHSIPLYDQNPSVKLPEYQNQKKHDKITIKNLPLSVSHSEVEKMLTDHNVTLASKVKYGCYREADGQLTTYKNGDRYVYVEPFDPPLPKQQKVGEFTCILLHHGKDKACPGCSSYGHKLGDNVCPANPTREILAFRGYSHPLSNHYQCELKVFGTIFKSVEHAFYYRMAIEMGKKDLADEIRACAHAGIVLRLSKDIAEDSIRWNWEKDHVNVMELLLKAKLEQCDMFRQCLIDNCDKILAEATPNKLWGTGMSTYLTQHVAPGYWPGQNQLGAILMDLAAELTSVDTVIHPVVKQSLEPMLTELTSADPPIHPVAMLSSVQTSQSQNSLPGVSPTPTRQPQQTVHPAVQDTHTPQTTVNTTANKDEGVRSRGRPLQRSPPPDRSERARSTPSRKDNSNVRTTSQDIRTLFANVRTEGKRKELASSPEQQVNGKAKRTDSSVT